jgi:HAD superfamily hydrolase (TIGR01509 family)
MSPGERPPDVLLVDLDGTLADSHSALVGCFDAFLGRRGITPRREHFEALDGVLLRDIPERLRERFGIDEPLENLRREYEQSVTEAYAAVEPADGAAELVRAAAAAGTALVLVTSAPRRLAESFLGGAGLANEFAAVISGEDAPPKPDPGLFLRGLEAVGAEPARALAIEDAPAGVRAAVAAGVRVIGVAVDERRATALRAAGAHEVAGDLHEVARVLAVAAEQRS